MSNIKRKSDGDENGEAGRCKEEAWEGASWEEGKKDRLILKIRLDEAQ